MADVTLEALIKLQDQYTATFQKIVTQTKTGTTQMAAATKVASTAMAGMSTAVHAVGAKVSAFAVSMKGMIAAYLGWRGVMAGWNAAKAFAGAEAAELAFRELSKTIDISTDAVKNWSAAVRYTMDDDDLMLAANKAISSGVVKMEQDFTTLTQAAFLLARAMGTDVQTALDQLIQTTAGGETRGLKKFGIDLEDAIRKSKDAGDEIVTLEQKIRLILKLLEQKVKGGFGDLGKVGETTSEAFQRLGVAMGNIQESIGRAIAPGIKDLANAMTVLSIGIDNVTKNKEAFLGFLKDIGKELLHISPLYSILDAAAKTGGALPKSAQPRPALPPGLSADAQRTMLGFPPEAPSALYGRAAAPSGFEMLRQQEQEQWDALKRVQSGFAPYGAAIGRAFTPKPVQPFAVGEETVTAKRDYGELVRFGYADELSKIRDEFASVMEAHEDFERRAGTMWEGMADGLKRYTDEVGGVFGAFSDATLQTFRTLEDTLGGVFFDAMQGKLQSFKEYMKQFVLDIIRMLAQLAAKMAIMGILNAIMPGAGSIGGSVAGLGSSMTSGFTSNAASLGTITGTNMLGVPGFAAGGIVTRPTLAVVGEAGPERITPLSQEGTVGGVRNVNITFQISMLDATDADRVFMKHRRTIEAIVSTAIRDDRGMRHQIRGA